LSTPTSGTDLIAGRYDEEFREVADVFRKQIAGTDGGAAVAVYHRGRLVVDLWGGVRGLDRVPWTRDMLAMCWSTTKGVVATCAHVLADRGDLDYDERVATYWPEFAQNGKGDVTVRQVLSHSAGLHRLGTIIDHGSRMLDWEHMTDALARAKPAYKPGTSVGYHALTFGWLVGELVRRISGTPIEEFLQKEIAAPLGLDGLHIGCPPEQRHRMAPLAPMSPALTRWSSPLGSFALNQVSRGLRVLRSPINPHRMINAALSRGMEDVIVDPRLQDAAVPAMNGYFDAVSLGAMYAMLAGGGQLGGVRILSEETVRKASEIQNDQRDRVIVMTMQWRLGYHRLPIINKQFPRGYGHFGFGGSGAFADPGHDLALAMVCNRGQGTPIGDLRILRLSQATARAVKSFD
jgi:CubicO group peptidase (beta-lactamase class C family)